MGIDWIEEVDGKQQREVPCSSLQCQTFFHNTKNLKLEINGLPSIAASQKIRSGKQERLLRGLLKAANPTKVVTDESLLLRKGSKLYVDKEIDKGS